MATVKKTTYGTNDWTPDAATGKAFFDTLNCSLIETALVDDDTFTVNIDDTVLLSFNGASDKRTITATIDGVTTTIATNQTYQTYGQKTFIVACSDNFVIIDLLGYSNRRFYLCYEKINGNKYYGYANESNELYLSNITIKDLSNDAQYKHAVRLNYLCDIGYLDYAPEILFNNAGTQKMFDDPNFIACSTVTAKQVITFNGKNYYSLSANTLVQMDD